ncbi:hypothetical protein [Pseudobacteriovorax antillogorgiicola]|uniref:Uncharacterized protein n=1 Tax=Pseudobacteriovorax antillogorgiicola TaxID=1513793 RepID=A0A1Y6B6V9_9BACT|nr:hypothetical protein [Pseudobacteriovorax antillogorgiicola]TCS58696.1 hypothetical protein EDD56_102209 [Pseudobacteriovorax antillogorgiicola]SME95738.1 hypothetical protein SAMN06296036_102234 [Pseudobacteriovorax antillogorgiicola]
MKNLRTTLGASLATALVMSTPSLAADYSNPSSTVEKAEHMTRTAIYDVFDKQTVVLSFTDSQYRLGEDAVEKLRAQLEATRGEKVIKRIHIATWADSNVPLFNESSSFSDDRLDRLEDLADNRADAVENEITAIGGEFDISVYNMAERPNWFNRTLETDDAVVKAAMSDRSQMDQLFKDDETYRLASLGKIFSEKGNKGHAVVVLETSDAKISH